MTENHGVGGSIPPWATPSRRRPGRLRERLFTGSLFALSLAVSLAAAEGIAERVVARRDGVPGPSPPGSFTWVNREFVQRQTNGPEGYRAAGFQPGPGTRNVLLIGDSFVEGVGLSDEQTIAWLLNQRFRDRRYQFWNAGKAGVHLVRALEIARTARERLPHRFDEAIVFVCVGNDVLDYDALPAAASARRKSHRLLPGLRRLVRLYRDGLEGSQWFRVRDVAPYVEWFDENRVSLGRSEPLDAVERARMAERFERIPAELRASLAEGLVNPWIFQWMLTPGLDDRIYNLDSERDRRALDSTLARLDAFASGFPGPVDVVLVPAKFQFSDEDHALARRILGDAAPEDEFRDRLAVNRALVAGLRRDGHVRRVIDLAPDVQARGWRAYYYPIDGHFHPGGAARVAERIAPPDGSGPLARRS